LGGEVQAIGGFGRDNVVAEPKPGFLVLKGLRGSKVSGEAHVEESRNRHRPQLDGQFDRQPLRQTVIGGHMHLGHPVGVNVGTTDLGLPRKMHPAESLQRGLQGGEIAETIDSSGRTEREPIGQILKVGRTRIPELNGEADEVIVGLIDIKAEQTRRLTAPQSDPKSANFIEDRHITHDCYLPRGRSGKRSAAHRQAHNWDSTAWR
jgi:hypothetical protein